MALNRWLYQREVAQPRHCLLSNFHGRQLIIHHKPQGLEELRSRIALAARLLDNVALVFAHHAATQFGPRSAMLSLYSCFSQPSLYTIAANTLTAIKKPLLPPNAICPLPITPY